MYRRGRGTDEECICSSSAFMLSVLFSEPEVIKVQFLLNQKELNCCRSRSSFAVSRSPRNRKMILLSYVSTEAWHRVKVVSSLHFSFVRTLSRIWSDQGFYWNKESELLSKQKRFCRFQITQKPKNGSALSCINGDKVQHESYIFSIFSPFELLPEFVAHGISVGPERVNCCPRIKLVYWVLEDGMGVISRFAWSVQESAWSGWWAFGYG